MDVMMFRVAGLESLEPRSWCSSVVRAWNSWLSNGSSWGRIWGWEKNWDDTFDDTISNDMKWYEMINFTEFDLKMAFGRRCRRSGDVVCLQDTGHVPRNVKSLQSTALVVSPSISHSVWVPRKCISSRNWWHRDSHVGSFTNAFWMVNPPWT